MSDKIVKLILTDPDEEIYTWECPSCNGNYSYSREINAMWGNPPNKAVCAVCGIAYDFEK